MGANRQHKKLYQQRRKHRLYLKGLPFHKRMIARVEEWNRRVLLGMLGAIVAPKRLAGPIDPTRVNRVLFVRNDAIGDMVLSTPMWRILKRRYPHITIGIVGSFRNLPIVANDPDIDCRYDGSNDSLRGYISLARKTRKLQWDVVMPLLYQKRTKFALLSRLLAPKAYSSMVLGDGRSVERYGELYSLAIPVQYDATKDLMFELLRMHFERTFGITVSDDEWRPSLRPNENTVEATRKRLNDLIEKDLTKGFIHINLEARGPFKEFGLSNSFELSQRLLATYPDHTILWTSSTVASQAAYELLRTRTPSNIHFFETPTLDDLIAVVRFATLVVTPDTSIVHIAAAEQKPLVGLYECLPHQWRPIHQPSSVVTPVLGEPVSTIPVEAVLVAVKNLLHPIFHS